MSKASLFNNLSKLYNEYSGEIFTVVDQDYLNKHPVEPGDMSEIFDPVQDSDAYYYFRIAKLKDAFQLTSYTDKTGTHEIQVITVQTDNNITFNKKGRNLKSVEMHGTLQEFQNKMIDDIVKLRKLTTIALEKQ